MLLSSTSLALIPAKRFGRASNKPRFVVTYEVVTPESAEEGDAAERGYAHPNGGNDELDKVENVSDYGWTLSQVVRRFGKSSFEDSGRWFDSISTDENYQTGARTRYSVHPYDNASEASYDRLRSILCWKV